MDNYKTIELSPTTLNLFLECPRCFWLRMKEKKYRPSGPFPSLPNGIDLFLKEYCDHFRGKVDLPPVLEGVGIKGKIVPDQQLVDNWRRGEGLRVKGSSSGIILYGKLDDALLLEDDYYTPFDFKTRGFPPKETHASYQLQMDVYSLLLQENGYKISNVAYLAYFYPKRGVIDFEKDNLPFNLAISEVKTNPEQAKRVFREATECLNKPLPEPYSDCAFCRWNLENSKT